ncbi:MAG: sensor domain-containing diguanylate cyclase [Pseudomonadota bacterium]
MLSYEDVLRLNHELTASGHWYVDFRDQTVFWSEEVFRMHGCDPNERQPTLSEALAFYHPDDREHVNAIVQKATETHEPFSYVARIVRRDGEISHIRSDGRVKCKDNGEPTWLFGILRDITNEWREQTHRQRLERVIEQTSEIMIMTDVDGRIEWANPAFYRSSGYTQDDYLGQKPGDLLQGIDTDPDTIAFMRQKLAAAEPFSTEILNYAKDGQPYWLRLSCHPDYNENGTHIGYSSIQSNVTQEKNTLMELEQEVERRKRLEAEYRYLVTHDSLSGLHNRSHFLEQGDAELRRCRRYANAASLLFIDFDEFKAINDELGHEAGDIFIEAFGLLCERTLREHDLAARWGGEEFVILMPETSHEGARRLAERLRSGLERLPISVNTQTVYVTASIGVAGFYPDEDTLQSLINRADEAMFEAKRAGRNCVFDADSS